jgi:hypothetical protein
MTRPTSPGATASAAELLGCFSSIIALPVDAIRSTAWENIKLDSLVTLISAKSHSVNNKI